MKVLIKGEAHKHDRIIVDCDFCETRVDIWRDEPGTACNYICEDPQTWSIKYTCPICGREVLKSIYLYSPEKEVGILKDYVMSKEDKKDLEEVMGWETAED